MSRQNLADILRGQDRSPGARGIRALLSLGIPAYALAVGLRNWSFNRGWRKPALLGRPVISVGNLTAGGTGKTPMVILLARLLQQHGHQPAVLLRGYTYRGAPITDSDEARLLQAELGAEVPVEPNPDRREGAQRVLSRQPEVSVFLLDDGFQHRQVHRDADIVLLDATDPFGGGRLLPGGLMREPAGALRRADLLVLTRADLVPPDKLTALRTQLQTLAPEKPVALAVSRWEGFRDASDQSIPPETLAGQAVAGVCGVGNPAQFALMLKHVCPRTVAVLPMSDHQVYTRTLLVGVMERAQRLGAQAIVTTEKDWVKWRPLLQAGAWPGRLSVYRPVLVTQLVQGAEAVERLLTQAAARPGF